MTMAAVHASLSHLVAGQVRNKAAISDAIDAVVSAHQHNGKDAFDDRVTDLRSTIAATFLTMDAIHDTVRTAVDLPPEPKIAEPAPAAQGEAQSAEDAAATRKVRATRTGVPEGE